MSHEDSVIVVFDCGNGERRYLAKNFNGSLYQTTDMRNAYMVDKGYGNLWSTPEEYAAYEVDRAYEWWPDKMPVVPTVRYMRVELREL